MFHSIDLLLVPAQSFAAPSLADMAMLGQSNDMISRLFRFTCPFDSSGNPTITLPGGFTASGLPIGLQLVGPHLSEALLVRAGRRLPIGDRLESSPPHFELKVHA